MGKITLDKRLLSIAEMLGTRQCVADIGTDHGRLGAYLLQQQRCEHVQFLDISAESLSKARALIGRMELCHMASFGVGNGAEAMTRPADGIVIAGMGGQLIADIVEAGVRQFRDALLVLQPNVAQYELRSRLQGVGFAIVDERIIKAGGRYYVLIAARAGEAHCSMRELVVGPRLLMDRPPELADYAARRLRIVKKALRGAEQGGAPWVQDLKFEVECWEGIINETGDSQGCCGAD